MNRLAVFAAILATVPAVAFADEPAPMPVMVPTIERVERPAAPVPIEFKCEVGDLLRLAVPGAKPDSAVQWRLLDPVNADISECDKGRKCSFVAKQPGVYRLLATIEGVDTFVAIIVGKPAPFVPPNPEPVADPLTKKLQAAYDADPAQLDARRAQLVILAALYDAAVKLPEDATINTRAELMKRLRDLATELALTGLTDVRKIIAEELNSVLADVVALDAAAKERAVAVLAKIRNALKAVK